MANINSNVKLITSDTAPTTVNLPSGNMAFGTVGGTAKLFGNIGSQVVEFTGGDGDNVIYFANEDELNTFLQGASVPSGEWYAAVAEEIYVSGKIQFTGANPQINVINGGYDLKVTKNGSDGLHIKYGDYTVGADGSGAAKRSEVNADVKVSIVGEVENPDGTINVTVNSKYTNFTRTLVNSGGVDLSTTIRIYASDERVNEVYTRSDNVNSGPKTYPDCSFNQTFKISKGQTLYVGVGRFWNDIDNSDTDDEFTGGVAITYPAN